MAYYIFSNKEKQIRGTQDIADPAAWAAQNLPGEWTWEAYTPMPTPTLLAADIMEGRRKKGREVVAMFGDDNFAAGINLSAIQTKALNEQFRPLREMLEGGFLGAALVYIRALSTDAILTPERKAKYRSIIEQYLAEEQI